MDAKGFAENRTSSATICHLFVAKYTLYYYEGADRERYRIEYILFHSLSIVDRSNIIIKSNQTEYS